MPFETKRIVQESDAYLVEVKYSVERRKIIPIAEGASEKKTLAAAEKQMRNTIITEVMKELHLTKEGSTSER